MYTVKEIFFTLQGEGVNAGRPAVFCRFVGCNLWDGREKNRTVAICTFCDTNFLGIGPDGGKFSTPDALADAVLARWPLHRQDATGRVIAHGGQPLVVCTGGEPLLQLDVAIVQALHDRGFEVAVETNGTQPRVEGLDHVCVSPKAGAALAITSGQELKLVFPQVLPDAQPDRFESLSFEYFFLQPMDGPNVTDNTATAIAYCLAHPQWRLSLQTHKLTGLR
jgi:7-carboxy-7-deazaguanine synthase